MKEELTVFRKMQRGDTSALEYFFQEYMELLYYRALGYVKDPAVAEDIVQEVFIRFWDNRHKLDISTSVPAYLSRSVVNSCKDHLDHLDVHRRYEEEYKSANTLEFMDNPDAEELEALRERLNVFIDSLPEKCREIFILACVEGLKYREVAERLDVSVNTVKTQVKSAYTKMRNDFDIKDRNMIIVFLLFQQITF